MLRFPVNSSPGNGSSPAVSEAVPASDVRPLDSHLLSVSSASADVSRQMPPPAGVAPRSAVAPEQPQGLRLMALLAHIKEGHPGISCIDGENEFREVYDVKNLERYGVTLPLREWQKASREPGTLTGWRHRS